MQIYQIISPVSVPDSGSSNSGTSAFSDSSISDSGFSSSCSSFSEGCSCSDSLSGKIIFFLFLTGRSASSDSSDEDLRFLLFPLPLPGRIFYVSMFNIYRQKISRNQELEIMALL